MLWLEVTGSLFLLWLILVFLFTPHIHYHLGHRTSVHADYEQDLADSREVMLERWRRPLWEKIAGPFVWILERQQ